MFHTDLVSISDDLSFKFDQMPLLQSQQYGSARYGTSVIRTPLIFSLSDDNNEPCGLIQAIVVHLPIIGKLALINRGPVLNQTAMQTLRNSDDGFYQILDCVRTCAIKQHWKYVRVIPEIYQNDGFNIITLPRGFVKKPSSPILSARVNIDRSLEEIRKSFHQKWRNLLNKSETSDLEINHFLTVDGVSKLLPLYKGLQARNNFKGLNPYLLKNIFHQKGDRWHPSIFTAAKNNRLVGALMAVGAGDTVTYLIGCTNEDGRELLANYILLWNAIVYYNKLGYTYFDVGGLGAQTTEGVGHFKRRLQGTEYSLIGEFSWAAWRK